jgi:predicted RecB family nuclease
LGLRALQAGWHHAPIYHYAAYEVSAMRKLMGRFGTREMEVDNLLRNEVFVDVYRVVQQSLRVGDGEGWECLVG